MLRISNTGAATFSSSVTAGGGFEIPNGQFYRARRSSSNILIDLLGIEAGTDNTRLLITGDFNIKNGSLTTLLNINTTGLASFNDNIVLNNGRFYQARRTSGGAIINVLGFESGTDDLVQVFSNNWKLRGTGGAGDEKITVTSGGYVGIGTPSPATLLQLNSATGVNTTLSFSENGTLKWYNRHNAGDGSYQIVDVTNSATRLNITSGGNLGLGVTPSAWTNPFNVLEGGGNGFQQFIGFQNNDNSLKLGVNHYYNGSNYVYSNNGLASRLDINADRFIWNTAPSGTAGNAISFTQAMTLFSNGNLAVGPTTDAGYKLDVNGSARATSFIKSGGTSSQFLMADGSVSTGSSGYKCYVALIGQIGTNAPTVTILENTIGAIVWSYVSPGVYLGTLSGAFTAAKTTCEISTISNMYNINFSLQRNNNSNQVFLQTLSSGTGTNGLLAALGDNSAKIEIRVYN